jgi:hypothetical protein
LYTQRTSALVPQVLALLNADAGTTTELLGDP